MTGAGHTAGPWEVQTPMGENCPWIVPAGKEAYEWEAIATLGDCLEDGPSPRSKAFRTIHADARLIVAACNSYDRHFGPRAIEAAEADLLGRALAALRMAAPLLAEAREALCGRDDVCTTSDGDDALLPLRDAINFILSQAREVK